MQFRLLDSIESFAKGVRLVGHKHVRPEEDYLADHFPEFPVLPGVFMLEAATQASAWLLRLSDNFEHSMITLKTARNIKYADFVKPGERLRIETELASEEDRLVTFKVNGSVDDRTTLTGKIIVERYNLAESDPAMADIDERLREFFRDWRDEFAAGLPASGQPVETTA